MIARNGDETTSADAGNHDPTDHLSARKPRFALVQATGAQARTSLYGYRETRREACTWRAGFERGLVEPNEPERGDAPCYAHADTPALTGPVGYYPCEAPSRATLAEGEHLRSLRHRLVVVPRGFLEVVRPVILINDRFHPC